MNIYVIGGGFLSDFNTCTIEECYEYCRKQKVLGLDIETSRKFNLYKKEGLDPYTSTIALFQIGTLEKQFIIDHRYQSVEMLMPLLSDPNIIKVGHNLKFEYGHILHNYKTRLVNIYDTQIVEEVLKNGIPLKFKLLDLVKRYLNKDVDKSFQKSFLKIGNRPLHNGEIHYGAEDIYNPLLIREFQLEEIIKLDIDACVRLENRFIPVLGNMEYKGMFIDQQKWIDLAEKKEKERAIQSAILDKFVIDNYEDTKFVSKQLQLFTSDKTTTINWGSSKQVIEFFRYLDICPQAMSKETKRLAYTTNAKVLKASLYTINKLASDTKKELILKFIRYKELEQSCTTFGKAFLKDVNPITKRIHSNYNQLKSTGRISSTRPNLLNIPSEIEYRQCFGCAPGWKIVNADFSSQEVIILANKSKESNLIDLIRSGNETHCFVVKNIHPELSTLTDKEIKMHHSDKRQVAKSANFAIQFGGTGYTISTNLGIPAEDGERIYEAYFKAFPQMKKYYDYIINKSLRQGYVLIDELTKRRFTFQDFYKLKEYKSTGKNREYYKLLGQYSRICLNYPIQGTAGSITKYALILMSDWITENNYLESVFITNAIYDELNVECKEELAPLVKEQVERCMIEAGALWCETVPLNAVAKTSDFWGHQIN